MAFEIFRPLLIFWGKIITTMSEKTGLAVLPANSSCTAITAKAWGAAKVLEHYIPP